MHTAFTYAQIHGLDAVELVAPDGSQATVLLQGAQLLSWRPAGAGEQLYLSPRSAFVSGTPVRGGVPVVFPQFDESGPLQKHGFARTRVWHMVNAEQHNQHTIAVFRLTDDAATRTLWPHHFELQLQVRIGQNELELSLTCTNKGDTPFNFTAALHTYLHLVHLEQTRLHGLQNLPYWDKVEGVEKTQLGDTLVAQGEMDRIYRGVFQPLSFCESGGDSQRTITIQQHGFEDVVIWHPGAEKCATLPDLPADAYRHMLCVEAAAIARPIQLDCRQSWQGWQRLTLA